MWQTENRKPGLRPLAQHSSSHAGYLSLFPQQEPPHPRRTRSAHTALPQPTWCWGPEIIFYLKERAGHTVTHIHSCGQVTNSRFLLESRVDKGREKTVSGRLCDVEKAREGEASPEHGSPTAPLCPSKNVLPPSSARQSLTPITGLHQEPQLLYFCVNMLLQRS